MIQDLRRLHTAETYIVDPLKRLHLAANADPVKKMLVGYQSQVQGNIHRLESAFRTLEDSPRGGRAEGVQALLHEAEDQLGAGGDPNVLDVAILAGLRRVISWNIATYESLIACAERLDHAEEAIPLLSLCLEGERAADQGIAQLFTTIEMKRESKG